MCWMFFSASSVESEPAKTNSMVNRFPSDVPAVSARLIDLYRAVPKVRRKCISIKFPRPNELKAFRRGLTLLLDNNWQTARSVFERLNLKLLAVKAKKRLHYVIHEAPTPYPRGMGFYVINLNPIRPLVLEAPHAQHDKRTAPQAIRYFLALGTQALFISTIHRCASSEATDCSGVSSACGFLNARGPYKRSDVAHTTLSFFHSAHRTLLDRDTQLIALQLHGFHRRPGRKTHLVFSNGTHRPGKQDSISNRLAKQYRARLPKKLRAMVRSCNELNNLGYLCGTHNVQGRYANGSPNACLREPKQATNRFLHIEQSLLARTRKSPFDPRILLRALKALFPLKSTMKKQ